MPLSGIEIYKYLPKTNCKKCGFPTCLAFAMKLAQKGVDLSLCPDVSEEAKKALDAASRPPIRLVTIGDGEKKLEVGNEVVLFRHEKTFYHPPGLMVRIKDTEAAESVGQRVAEAANYYVERVGQKLAMNGFAIENASGDVTTFVRSVEAVSTKTDLPLVLMSPSPEAMGKALEKVGSKKPLIHAATGDNWDKMAHLAVHYKCPLAIADSESWESLTDLSEKVNKVGVEDIVLDPGLTSFSDSLTKLTQIRRLALRQSFRPLGYPVITFPGAKAENIEEEALLAAQAIAKYAGIIALDHFAPAMVYPLLTLRMNIYTDPQKPIQVTPGLYPLGSPKETSPLLVTTNFSLTYFSVAGELEASGFPSWLMVVDTEGLSVLTGWAAGKFDAERIAKATKANKVEEKIGHKSLVIPGAVAVLRGELEEELPQWKIMVGPREAVDIGSYLKRTWTA